MLIDLKVLNGNLELKYNEYTYEYTVSVDNNIDKLEFEYKIEENSNINIRNNILNEEENTVYIDVYNNSESITYTFYVYKENINLSSGIENYKKSIEVVDTEEVDLYKIQFLVCGMFLLIIIIFSILFRRKKIK